MEAGFADRIALHGRQRVHGNMDYLLTWNCRHLANASKIQHLAVLNGRLGLHVPVVTTPLNLIPPDSKSEGLP